ncbi:MAG: potassium transporter Kup [Rhodanobacteraceae bacterium]
MTDLATTTESSGAAGKKALPVMVVGAIGVVFGDLGTSPLYTFSEAFSQQHGMPVTEFNVLGVLSLVFWTLLIVVVMNYVNLIMRADNNGEGGIMALMALAQRATRQYPRTRRLVALAAVLGVALFFGDGVITPSISVLSAVEGVEVAAPGLSHWVVPLTVIILFLLFFFQKYGSGKVGGVFGPVMCVWFVCIGLVGAYRIVLHPFVLRALSPWYGVNFFVHHGADGFIVLGAVVLCVTGAEALYADMGHFGRNPIKLAWYVFVMPGLLLNYFGQGALLIHDPAAVTNPFYFAVPKWGLYPMIVLATAATVIASQAVISGTFSLIRQAIQLGFLQRMPVVHTSNEQVGQIYLPWVNRILLIIVILVVVGFGSSEALAGAYGIAVTGAMTIDSTMFLIVAWRMWKWHPAVVALLGFVMLTVDLVFFGANTLKIPDGGWFPLVLALAVFAVMTTWRRGRELVLRQLKLGGLALVPFIANLAEHPPTRVEGTAIFLVSDPDAVPHALLHNLKHNKVLHRRNLILTVDTLETPYADPEERIDLQDLGHDFHKLTLRFGFADDPNVPKALHDCARRGLDIKIMDTTFFLSRETIVATDRPGMALWRDKLFAFLARNALPATAFFSIPGNRLIELGAQVEI